MILFLQSVIDDNAAEIIKNNLCQGEHPSTSRPLTIYLCLSFCLMSTQLRRKYFCKVSRVRISLSSSRQTCLTRPSSSSLTIILFNLRLTNVFSIFQAINLIVPRIFPRTKDDVKLSLVLESVPKLTKILRQN